MSEIDRNSFNFVMGSLTQQMKDFAVTMVSLTAEVKGLRADIDEIKLFRAKVLGASLVVSLLGSALFAIGMEAVKAWAK